jgi:hypothetical protein
MSMSRLPSPRRLHALGLLALVLAGTSVQAADFDGFDRPRPDLGSGRGPGFEEDYGHRPPPPPRFPRFSAGPDGPPHCRVFVKRRLDADGEPVIRRVRVCDEPDDLGPPRRPRFDPPSDFPDGPEGRWGGPRW